MNNQDDEVMSYASDYHKECFGFRPRGMQTREDAERIIERCSNWFDQMASTPSGLEALRADGWMV
jgi:hypothetical protein